MGSLSTELLLLGAFGMLCCGGNVPGKSGKLAPTATGSIEGTVQLAGEELPEATYVANTTDPEICGRGHTLEDLVVSTETRGVRYAIVALGHVPSEVIPPFEPELIVMDNVDCRFEPHAVAVTLGSTLEALNSDPVLHTTHLYGPADVNISLPVKGARSSRKLEREGTYVVKCDIHGWMQAFVRVDPHPFHAVSGENGSFRIDGIPVGRYVLQVWHERLGTQEMEVQIEDGVTVSVRIEYSYPDD